MNNERPKPQVNPVGGEIIGAGAGAETSAEARQLPDHLVGGIGSGATAGAEVAGKDALAGALPVGNLAPAEGSAEKPYTDPAAGLGQIGAGGISGFGRPTSTEPKPYEGSVITPTPVSEPRSRSGGQKSGSASQAAVPPGLIGSAGVGNTAITPWKDRAPQQEEPKDNSQEQQ